METVIWPDKRIVGLLGASANRLEEKEMKRPDGRPTTGEIVEVLEQVKKYLEHPDIQAIPFALSAAVPLANVKELIAVLTE